MAAIYQWFPSSDIPTFQEFDIFAINSDNADHLRLVGVDFATQSWEEYGSFPAGFYQDALATDRTTWFMRDAGTNIRFLVWRGNCYSQVLTQDHLGNNGINDLIQLKGFDQKIILCATNAFGHGLRVGEYGINPPTYTHLYQYNPTLDYWAGFTDLRFGNKGTTEQGDALLCLPQNGNYLTTYKNDGGVLTLVDQLAASTLGSYMSWGADRDSGLCVTHGTAATTVNVYQVDMSDLTLSSIGTCGNTLHDVRAATFTPNGYLLTVEDSGLDDSVRTYVLNGTTLTHIDTFQLNGGTNTNAKWETSPRTGRIWLLCPSSSIGFSAFRVDNDGTIYRDFQNNSHVFYNSGADGHRIAFLYDPPNITTNGFTGIKQKLLECWEMNEVGSVTRTGDMGNMNLVVSGTVNSTVNALGTAAHFTDGTSALYITGTPETQGVGSFSMCLDVVIDDKTAEPDWQNIFVLAPFSLTANWAGCNFGLYYSATQDRFVMFVPDDDVGFLITKVVAADTGPIVNGTKYHIYFDYSTVTDTIGIRVNGGTYYTSSYPQVRRVGTGRYMTFGRGSNAPAWDRGLIGATNRAYYFWDTLTTVEQDFMYNGGASRDFIDL